MNRKIVVYVGCAVLGTTAGAFVGLFLLILPASKDQGAHMGELVAYAIFGTCILSAFCGASALSLAWLIIELGKKSKGSR